MIKFFNKEEEERIIKAIQSAELNTSGEIRVHIEADAEGDIRDIAAKTCNRLGMHETKARNGVMRIRPSYASGLRRRGAYSCLISSMTSCPAPAFWRPFRRYTSGMTEWSAFWMRSVPIGVGCLSNRFLSGRTAILPP